ncbi:MAG: sensor domain-containing diguanylate cyclase [Actinomycetota bacterium]
MSPRAQNHADLVRYSPTGCVLVDDGIVQGANPEATETLGIPLGHLMGVDISEFFVAESQNGLRALLDIESGTSTRRLRLCRRLLPLELTARRLPDGLVIMAIRSMEPEHYYSALARAELTHDPLTGLANRFYLLGQLQDRIEAPERSPMALVGLWIDELPDLVVSRGARAVDRVVKEVGSRLQGRLRSPDVLGRYDEAGFVTLLTSDAGAEQLKTIGERLRDEVAFPVEFDGNLVSFTASVALGSLVDRRPPIERVMTALDTAAARNAASDGRRTEILEL